ncbi:MAG: UDP-N-acetylmuramoyl-L-alanine--D-glutamate ligase [Pseudomonadota bacterium]
MKKKRVTVYGMGKSGLSALQFLLEHEADVWAVSKGAPATWPDYQKISAWIGPDKCLEEDFASNLMAESELIVLSPGIPRQHPILQRAHRRGIPLWSEIELASRFINIPILAVTGSNGKTTTVTLLSEMLTETGHDVFVGGNIGTPLCDFVLKPQKVDYILLELSSFQLESIEEFHPHLAIILNVFSNHGERYNTVNEYTAAKFNITKNMGENDHLIYRQDPQLNFWTQDLKCQKYPINTTQVEAMRAEMENFFKLEKFKLPGTHNLTNLYFSFLVFKILKLKMIGIQKVVDSFNGVSYRMQKISGDYPFIPFNDAKSTNWDATMTAIRSLQIEKKGRPLFVIIGGQPRGRGDSLGPHLAELASLVDKVLLIGETTEELAGLLVGKIPYQRCYTLADALKHVYSLDFNGALLFSPGLPSFDQYENYQKRGESFNQLLKTIS